MPKAEINLLVVDDSAADVELLTQSLSDEVPPKISTVADGEAAMAFLTRADGYEDVPRPDLVILDLNLPKMNGTAVLSLLRASAPLSNIPVIMWSSSDAPHDIESAYAHGANAYVSKPLDFPEFQRTVQALEAFWFHAASLPPAGVA